MSIAAENRETCLKVTDLKMYFPVKSGIFSKARSLKAVDGVSFSCLLYTSRPRKRFFQ